MTRKEKEGLQFSSLEFLIVLLFVISGTLLGAVLDRWGISGLLPEGVVRALAGTADTLGFAVIGLYVSGVFYLNPSKKKLKLKIFNLKREYNKTSKSEHNEWVRGGLLGLAIAFILQILVFNFSSDPHGPVGIIYAFGFSNLDNVMAGLIVLISLVKKYGLKSGSSLYWTHPFYVGNVIMVTLIPCVALLIRLFAEFRPELNLQAGIESGLMDIDSIGAFLIFLFATRVLDIGVPVMIKRK